MSALTRWRILAGASSLFKLLDAWQVVGPVGRAIEILRDFTLEARAAQQLRHRRLRCVREDATSGWLPIYGRSMIQYPEDLDRRSSGHA